MERLKRFVWFVVQCIVMAYIVDLIVNPAAGRRKKKKENVS